MKRFLIILFVATFFLIAYASKPDDKTCIIAAVKEVWGDKTPDPNMSIRFFNQFMDLTSKSVKINDWVILKQVEYQTNKGLILVGFGAFKRFIPARSPF